MKFLLTIIIALTLGPVVFADESLTFKTLDGKEYKSVTISGKDSAGIRVMTDSGIEQILYDKLPPEIQKVVGYDAEKVHTEERARQEAQAKLEAQFDADTHPPKKPANPTLEALERRKAELLAELLPDEAKLINNHPAAVTIFGTVLQKLPHGLLVKATAETLPESKIPFASGIVFVTGYPRAASLVDDDPIQLFGEETEQLTYTTALGASKTVRSYKSINSLDK